MPHRDSSLQAYQNKSYFVQIYFLMVEPFILKINLTAELWQTRNYKLGIQQLIMMNF